MPSGRMPPVGLRDEGPTGRLRPVGARVDPPMEIADPIFEVDLVLLPGDAVDSGGRFALERVEAFLESGRPSRGAAGR